MHNIPAARNEVQVIANLNASVIQPTLLAEQMKMSLPS